MPDVFAYREGFDLNTAEPVRVEVLVLRRWPRDLDGLGSRREPAPPFAARKAQGQPPATPQYRVQQNVVPSFRRTGKDEIRTNSAHTHP
jgi:hypothetical protein